MKLFISVLGFLFILAWLCERWGEARERMRRERGKPKRWWKEPRGDDNGLDGDY